jgi:hypothetical protein
VDIEEEIGKHPLAQSYWTKLLDDILVVSMAEHNGNYSSFKMFLTGVLEFRVRFFKKSHAVDGKFQGLKVVQAPRNR